MNPTLLIAGVDFSTFAVDIVVLPWDQDSPRWQRFMDPDPRTDGEWRSLRACRRLARLVTTWIGWQEIDVVYVERPFGKGEAIHQLMRTQGAIIAAIPRHVPIVEELNVQTWKKLLTGNGNARKATVTERLRGLGFELHDAPQDAWDALGIAWAGRELNAQGVAAAEAATV